jgi:hypothetical protein
VSQGHCAAVNDSVFVSAFGYSHFHMFAYYTY